MDKWEIYKDGSNEWRWRRTAPNGRIVGASSQGYVNKSDCIANARRNGYRGVEHYHLPLFIKNGDLRKVSGELFY